VPGVKRAKRPKRPKSPSLLELPPAESTPAAQAGPVPDAAELDRLAGEVAADSAQEPPPPPPAGESFRPEVHEGPAPKTDEELEAEAAAKLKAKVSSAFGEEDIQAALELAFWLVAMRRGPHWELTKPEGEKLGHWLHRSLAKHERLLAFIERWGTEVITAGLFVGVIRERLEKDAELEDKQRAAQPKPAPSEPPPPAAAEPVPEPDAGYPPSPPPAPPFE
jgi:hypothetical protein